MDGKIDVFILVSLVVAVIAIWKLYSILGTSGDSRRSQRPATERRRDTAPADSSVVTLPQRREQTPSADPTGELAVVDAEQRIRSFGNDPSITQGLLDIFHLDPAFEPATFIKGAKQAYEMIVTAFAEGNRKILKDLLAREVNDEFAAEMTARDKRGEVIDQSFVGINKADILDAEVRNGTATITIRFVSQLISATRDRAGAVTSGDPQKIKEATDVWTFSRDISNARARQNLNWRLVATQES